MPSLRAEHGAEHMRIFRAGLSVPLLTQHAARGKRPYIHPLLAPDGVGELTENEPGHHLWQHGLYVGLNDVNGVGFWTESLHEKNKATDGSFHPLPLEALKVDGQQARWRVVTEWRSPKGEPLLTETQDWCLDDRGEELVLDLDWKLRGLTQVIFGQYAYGGLFLRMLFRSAAGSRAVNSEGHVNSEAEAQRARWVAVEMPIPGREGCTQRACSIAMLDHPHNPGHPVSWRVDGQLGIAPSRCISGAWKLAKGEETRSRYRLIARTGSAYPEEIAQAFNLFSKP